MASPLRKIEMMHLDECTVYVFVRQDIPLEQQFIQGCHAVLEMMKFAEFERHGTPNLITVGMPNLKALERVIAKLDRLGIEYSPFADPDFNFGLAAVATVPLDKEQKLPLANYRLWRYSPGASAGQAEACSVTADRGANAAVAQLREHSEFNRGVTGENPVSGSIPCE